MNNDMSENNHNSSPAQNPQHIDHIIESTTSAGQTPDANDGTGASDPTLHARGKTRGRKRILNGPPYICQHPNCNKSFQRSEHLSRHKLNHNPKTIFTCHYPGCDKTFVRHDLLIRHLKRHDNKIQKQKLNTKSSEFLSKVVSNNLKSDSNSIPSKSTKINFKNSNMVTASASEANSISAKDIVKQHSQINLNSNTPTNANKPHSITEPSIEYRQNRQPTDQNQSHYTNNTATAHSVPTNTPTAPNLFSWLFTDPGLVSSNQEVPSQNSENYFHESNTNPINSSTSGYLNNNANNINHSANNNNDYYHNANHNQDVNNNNNFLSDLNEFHMNNNTHNFFIVQDDFSPSSSSTGYFGSTPDHNSNSASPNFKRSNPSNKKRSVGNGSSSTNDSSDKNLHSFQHSQGQQVSENSAYHFDEVLLYTLTPDQMKEFETLIPALKGNVDFTKLKFEKALKTYWNFFHPRFPMLHRPTFNSTDAPNLLLLAMVVLGSKLFMCVDNITCPDDKKILQPKILSDTITEPLRWLLFASPFFQPPAEVWIIQSLLMLEFYEKNCSNRRLHERSHLHHGTTIQLLRRSPTLGGASTKFNNESGNDETDNWYKWIEIESMKRATFMCFYMDAIDAICMGHQMFIYSHQIQMTMPVEDVVWESNFNQFNKNYKLSNRPKQFLIVLKNIMNGKPARTNSFGKKILLAGLNAILFQIQQRDLQLFFGLDKFTNTISENWRDLLTAAFAIWRNDVGSSCCSSKTAIDNLNSLGNSSQFSTSDTRCKCVSYHLAHIYMSISHYDIFIVSGAPWRMNVKPSSTLERNSIKNRVIEWSKTRHCEVAIVQCYLSLFEMFLSPQDSTYEYQYNYLPDADLFFRSYSLGYMLLVIWCFLYAKDKFKNLNLNNDENNNGYLYLKNIRNQFTLKSEGILLHTWFTNPTGADFYGDLMRWVNVLCDIDGIGNIVGLLNLVGTKLANADYIVVKELGKLLLFCRDRSTGATSREILEDMYISDKLP